MSRRDPSNDRRPRGEFNFGVSDARDGNLHRAAKDDDKPSATAAEANVLQDIASALGGLDHVASWLYWERRGSASWSPLDGASNERRAAMLAALECVERARRKPHPR